MINSEFLTLAEATKIVPGRPSIPTLWRWCVRGVGGVKLRSGRAGRRIVTTEAWLEDFYGRLGEAREAERESAEVVSAI